MKNKINKDYSPVCHSVREKQTYSGVNVANYHLQFYLTPIVSYRNIPFKFFPIYLGSKVLCIGK